VNNILIIRAMGRQRSDKASIKNIIVAEDFIIYDAKNIVYFGMPELRRFPRILIVCLLLVSNINITVALQRVDTRDMNP